MKTIDIFYKSYAKDFPLLKYSLMSLYKNVSGYNRIIIVVPSKDIDDLIALKFPLELKVTIQGVYEQGNGYLYQQICKMDAHKWSNADFIMYADSDCIFDHKVNLQDYIKTGKPEILYTDYDMVGDARCWQQCTQEAVGWSVHYEFMRRNFLIYHTSTLRKIAKAYPHLEQMVMASERFSEFNFMGAYAFKMERKKYSFVNTATWEYTTPIGCQLWGWAQKDNQDPTHIYEYNRSLGIINTTLDLNLTEI